MAVALPAVEWAPACMDAGELAGWRDRNARLLPFRRAERPCEDCLLGFAAEMRAEGRCNGEPGGDGEDQDFTRRRRVPAPAPIEEEPAVAEQDHQKPKRRISPEGRENIRRAAVRRRERERAERAARAELAPAVRADLDLVAASEGDAPREVVAEWTRPEPGPDVEPVGAAEAAWVLSSWQGGSVSSPVVQTETAGAGTSWTQTDRVSVDPLVEAYRVVRRLPDLLFGVPGPAHGAACDLRALIAVAIADRAADA